MYNYQFFYGRLTDPFSLHTAGSDKFPYEIFGITKPRFFTSPKCKAHRNINKQASNEKHNKPCPTYQHLLGGVTTPWLTIPYHTILSGPPWPRFATNNAEADLWPNVHALLKWEGRVGSVSKCRWCAATATFTGSACV